MTLQDRLTEDLRQAMRSGDTLRRDVVRMARNAISYAEKAKGAPLDDAEALTALQQQARQRRDSIEAYRAAGRDDRTAQESAELAVLEEYLPQLMGRDEVEAAARAVIAELGATGPGDKGKVMGRLMGQLKGKADGGLVNATVTELLQA
ncbi:MAG: GatB/YqeY domain-containing protein [Chloroflexota bacterium]|nr:GatB/YqeY domain-containing protein [Chloroflexota bacterium]